MQIHVLWALIILPPQATLVKSSDETITNFAGEKEEISFVLNGCSSQRANDTMWFGWSACFKVASAVIRLCLGLSRLNGEILGTTLCSVEQLMNYRLLVSVSVDPGKFDEKTPNSFLSGRPTSSFPFERHEKHKNCRYRKLGRMIFSIGLFGWQHPHAKHSSKMEFIKLWHPVVVANVFVHESWFDPWRRWSGEVYACQNQISVHLISWCPVF